MMKIAVLFKGLIRPNYQQAFDVARHQLMQFRGHELQTYLATWRTHNALRADEFSLITHDIFRNAIILDPPSPQRCRQIIDREYYRPDYNHNIHGAYPISHVINPYFQNKTALDIITQCDDYDYIVNTRLDLYIDFGEHLGHWFDPDHLTSPETPVPWINDWISIATPDIMRRAWDYGTPEVLGQLIEQSEIPEHILMAIMDRNGVKNRQAPFASNYLLPNRFD